MKKIILYALTAAMMCLAAGCAKETAEVPELLTPVGSAMDTAACERGTLEATEVYEAAFTPGYTEVYFDHDAKIGKVNFTVGQQVNEGDILVEMDLSGVNGEIAALDAEKASLEAEAEYARAIHDIDAEIASLELKKLEGDAAYDKETEIALYELEYENAAKTRGERLTAIEASRAELAKQLENTTLAAPCSGRLTYIGYNEGQTAGAFDTVCVVTDDSSMYLQSRFISAADIDNAAEYYAVAAGQRFEITPVEIDEAEYARAMLREIEYPRTFELGGDVEAAFGDTAVVYLVTLRMDDVLKVPLNAVFSDDEGDYVYVTDGETRSRRSVEVGATTYAEAEIASGLEEGELVYVGD